MVVYIMASPSPNRAMCVRALLDDTTGSVLRLLPPAIALEDKISPTAPRNPPKGSNTHHSSAHHTPLYRAISVFLWSRGRSPPCHPSVSPGFISLISPTAYTQG